MSADVKRYRIAPYQDEYYVLASDYDAKCAELAEANTGLEIWRVASQKWTETIAERDALRAEVERLRGAIVKAGGWIETALRGDTVRAELRPLMDIYRAALAGGQTEKGQ